MGTRSWIGSWPVYRQLTGTDRRGLGAAAKSGHSRQARTIFEAGMASARDPKYTIVPQRRWPNFCG